MALANDTASMALFCDFENIALGVRDAQYEKFDIRPILERLLAKGSIVVKKAYCDWERYKGFKSGMHEANFELIEIPHVRQSGKNSADIRMVVDALDLCYTKSHVDTFVIISGDSDFSPLVSKLRENAKKVIGVGVKQSCSDLLITNCDEFIYYDDLVRDREASRSAQRREREKRSPEDEAKRREKLEERKAKAVDLVSATFVDLIADRGESERIWASVLKEVVKRRNPGFNESYFGFRSFGNLLEEAASRGLLGFGRDDKGAFVFRAQVRPAGLEPEIGELPVAGENAPGIESMTTPAVDGENAPNPESPAEQPAAPAEPVAAGEAASSTRRRGGRRSRGGKDRQSADAVDAAAPVDLLAAEAGQSVTAPEAVPEPAAVPVAAALAEAEKAEAEAKPRRAPRRPRKAASPAEPVEPAAEAAAPAAPSGNEGEAAAAAAPIKAAKATKARRPARPARPRQAKASDGTA